MKLLIKNGHLIDPVNQIDSEMDILIENGRIRELGVKLELEDAEQIDASGKIVCPGFIDLHVHLREPGFEYKEDIASGTRAAAAGGFTTVCCMPNTDPVIDNAAVANFVRERAQFSGVVHVLPIGCITRQQQGELLSPMAELVAAGCVAVSDDGKPVMNARIMRNALDYAKMFPLPVLVHCEDTKLSHDGQMHEGYYSTIYGLKGIPTLAEETMIARDLMLAEYTGAHLHICHVSTAGSVQLIRAAKQKGIAVTCEVTPHHLTLTDEIVGDYDPDTKVNPPLRSQKHLDTLLEGLQDGTIDCIATDHAPHHREDKDCEYNMAAFGISGLETAVAVLMDRLIQPGKLELSQLVSFFTSAPARILGFAPPVLAAGAAADLTIIDPDMEKEVDPASFHSKGKNNPYKGMHLKGWPWMTIVDGKVVAHEGKIQD